MKRSRNNLVITLLIIFVLMVLLVVFTMRVIYRTAFKSTQEMGDDKATAITADLENYLETAKSVLWLAADTVDHMVQKGAAPEEIIEYITRESSRTEQQFDESYTGIYGVVNGTYVDGVGWVPPEDYDPVQRDWYIRTVKAGGEVIIIPPYVDAQTGNVIISVGRALSDNNNALALDLTLNGVQEIVEGIRINDYGYGYIVDRDGLVVAHHNREEIGKNYRDQAETSEIYQKSLEIGKGHFDMNVDKESCTVFVDNVMDQWTLIIVVKNADLYRSAYWLMFVSILVTMIIFMLISIFYFIGYQNERKYSARMEEMKEIERRKDYEAKVLKLEKSAADSANKAKSSFLSDMSHEIRTPINAILGMNEMILHESGEADTREYAANIKSAGNTLLAIINSILDFSKIEDGRMSLVPVEFETRILMNGLINSISERAKAKELELKVDIDESIPSRLMGDDVRISQIIMNLLTNAVKYTEKGYVQLSIKNLGLEDERCRLLVAVEDTGIGIRKEDISKLSISFERVDEKKNRHIEGTGLGISIVTRLLTMMGSSLKVESEYGRGSLFSFELLVDVADATPMGPYNLEARGETGTLGDAVSVYAPGARILLTDDNEMNCRVAEKLMKLFGIRPTVCRSGQETIEKMRGQSFDILFLDHMMPVMDGIETLKILKEEDLSGDTKIIALTANAVVGAREQYLDAGFDDYLAKPIRLPELDRMLRKYLSPDLLMTPPKEQKPGQTGAGETGAEHTEPGQTGTGQAGAEHTGAGETWAGHAETVHTEPGQTGRKPEETVQTETGKTRTEGSDPKLYEGRLGDLQRLGLSVESGLTYCADDEEFYFEMLQEYVTAAEEKEEKMDSFLQEGNLRDYKVLVHSLKSASKTIGSTSMFQQALDLETAAGEGRTEYIQKHHPKLMEDLRTLVDQLKQVIET